MKKRTLRDARRQRVRSDESHHGDWRMEIRNPHEVEHLQMQPVHNLFHRTRAKTQYLRNVAVADYSYASDAVADWTPAHGLKRAVRLILALFVMLPLSVVMIYALLIQLYHAAPGYQFLAFGAGVVYPDGDLSVCLAQVLACRRKHVGVYLCIGA